MVVLKIIIALLRVNNGVNNLFSSLKRADDSENPNSSCDDHIVNMLSLSADEHAKPRPQRIVSTGLCADQLLLMIADRSQIASLSSFVTDPNMSYMIDAVGDLPLNNSSVEEVIPYAPDLVVGSSFCRMGHDAVFAAPGVPGQTGEPADHARTNLYPAA